MKKVFLPLIGLILLTVGCSPVENKARDTVAALQGSLQAASDKFGKSCEVNSSPSVCGLIKRGAAVQHDLVLASETYCGWDPAKPPVDQKAKCIPVKSLEQALVVATANAAPFILELRGAL